MWQLLRRELTDNFLWLVLVLLVFGIAFAFLVAGSPIGVSSGWESGWYLDIARGSLMIGTVGWLLAYLLGQSQVRTARWRGLSDHLAVLPITRLTVDLVRTVAGLALLLL